MIRLFKVFSLASLLVLALCSACLAAQPKTFVVLPFTVNGPDNFKYLEQSIPPMLNSRLHWAGNYEQYAGDSAAAKTKPANEAAAAKALQGTGADYVIWGSVTVIGEECSIDANVIGKDGTRYARSRQARTDQLITALTAISGNISSDVFGRPSATAVAVAPEQPQKPAEGQSYLNPSIRHSGGSSSDQTRLRSQQLNFSALGMEICDADGDGKNEVFLIDEFNIYAFAFENNRLRQLSSMRISLGQSNISLRSFDFNRSGKPKLILTSVDSDQEPVSRVFSFDGKSFTLEMDRIPFFLNVIRDQHNSRPMLIGQRYNKYDMFRRGSLCEMIKSGDTLQAGPPLGLPEAMNVYNFVYVPQGMEVDNEPKIAIISKTEKLTMYTMGGSKLSESQEMFGGSPVGLEINPSVRGLGDDTETLRGHYYIPIRMIVCDLDNDRNFEVIANRPNTEAGRVFKRFRSFQQSIVSSMYWEGVGMSEQWRTRIIQGGVVDISLSDLNNDGTLDLVSCVQVGGAAITQRKTVVLGYSLDLSGVEAGQSDLVRGGK